MKFADDAREAAFEQLERSVDAELRYATRKKHEQPDIKIYRCRSDWCSTTEDATHSGAN